MPHRQMVTPAGIPSLITRSSLKAESDPLSGQRKQKAVAHNVAWIFRLFENGISIMGSKQES